MGKTKCRRLDENNKIIFYSGLVNHCYSFKGACTLLCVYLLLLTNLFLYN